jgi:glucose dehydrogenase
LGLIYVPLGNMVPDQLGMGRSANVEKFSSSITALDMKTGQVKWVQQTVHHDLWDMDVPAQPVLFDMKKADGTVVPALVGPTKQGDIYVLDRRTGAPIIPFKEIPAPQWHDPRRSRFADAADLRPDLLAATAAGEGHVGRFAVRPAGVPDRVPPLQVRRPLHAAVA